MPRPFARRCLAVLLSICPAAGCAPSRRPPEIAPIDRRGDVERLIRSGCYTCLRDALALVEQGASPNRRFDILALLASRVREIGFADGHNWRVLAEAAMPTASPRATLLLMLVDHARVPQGGQVFPQPDLTHERRLEIARLAGDVWPTLPDDPVDVHFRQTLMCLGIIDTRGLTPDDRPAAWPLTAYRRATCGTPETEGLAAVLTAEPRFVESHYFAAVAALGGGALLSTERALDSFEAAFPGTTTASFLRGQVLLGLEEFEAAADRFAHVLSIAPAMPEALLYHMRALSHVDPLRGEAAADRLVALGTWYQGEAFYWRAWNRRALKRLVEAASDIETAKRVVFNAAVPKLAGFIAYERDELPLAERELLESVDRNASDCEVQFALGQVLTRTRRWAEAAQRFVATIECARVAQAALATRRAEVAAAELDTVRRERLAVRIERDRQTERVREGYATLSAASAFVLAGRAAEACPLAEAALNWPETKAQARDLLGGLAH